MDILTTDPELMTLQERQREVATLLARGLKWRIFSHLERSTYSDKVRNDTGYSGKIY